MMLMLVFQCMICVCVRSIYYGASNAFFGDILDVQPGSGSGSTTHSETRETRPKKGKIPVTFRTA